MADLLRINAAAATQEASDPVYTLYNGEDVNGDTVRIAHFEDGILSRQHRFTHYEVGASDDATMTLAGLPKPIFSHILTFLHADALIMRQVCKAFTNKAHDPLYRNAYSNRHIEITSQDDLKQLIERLSILPRGDEPDFEYVGEGGPQGVVTEARSLRIKANAFVSRAFDHLSIIFREHLHLEHLDITDCRDIVSQLWALRIYDLKSLKLGNVGLNPPVVNSLFKNAEKLEILDLSVDVTKHPMHTRHSHIKVLTDFAEVNQETYEWSFETMRDEPCGPPFPIQNLKVLNLSGTAIPAGTRGIPRFKVFLGLAPQNLHIILNHCEITNEDVEELRQAFPRMTFTAENIARPEEETRTYTGADLW